LTADPFHHHRWHLHQKNAHSLPKVIS
jgi:hypothetical protein